jgi:hypothetical protein
MAFCEQINYMTNAQTQREPLCPSKQDDGSEPLG